MIQYSNINDAWGNKEIFKKNILNNNNNIGNPVAAISPKGAESIHDILLAPVNNNNISKVEQNIEVPVTANFPLSNTQIKNQQNETNIVNPVPKNIIDIPIISNKPINNINKEHFNSCSFAEHLNNCEKCRNTILEQFTSKSTAHINLLGLEFDISKDVLKVVFVIIIVIIFVLLLSLINIPMKDDLNVELQKAFKLKYLMMNNMPYHYY